MLANDPNASGGQYVHVPEGFGTRGGVVGNNDFVSYQFNVTEVGIYRFLGWIYAAGGSDDSFYVTVDGQPAAGYLWDITPNTSYLADFVSDRGGADPVELSLGPGVHTITFYLREDAARLDRFIVEPNCAP